MKKIIYGCALTLCMAFISFSSNSQLQTPYRTAQPEFSVKCCKTCKAGKACGDSCISKKYECHQPKGCACNG